MDTLIKESDKDDRNTQETLVKLDRKINLALEEGERRYTRHSRSPHYGDACERCGFQHIWEEKFSPEVLKGLGKNIDIEKLKGQALRNLGG